MKRSINVEHIKGPIIILDCYQTNYNYINNSNKKRHPK